MAALNSELTPELVREGLARELVRRIQDMRKKAGFNIEDRITTWYQAGNELAGVFAAWSAYIQSETLSSQLLAGAPQAGAYSEEQQVEGLAVMLGVRKL